jgi:methylated-DNA-[protein]-cysteine S-methyltransferase
MTTLTLVDSPLGVLRLVADDGVLAGLYLPEHRHAPDLDLPHDSTGLPAVRAQLAEYFEGRRTTFDLPLAVGGTAFQREVWSSLATIPYGDTWSYAKLAAEVGRPRAVRAVGLANGRNPVSIVVPCHRVVGADGALTGYAGGLAAKRWLLALEGTQSQAGSRGLARGERLAASHCPIIGPGMGLA